MKTYPDFTWEWIVESCTKFCEQHEIRNEAELESKPERIKTYFYMAQGLINIVPELREHPQLGQFIPMKSLLGLRWFPSDKYEITLVYLNNKYRIHVLETDQREKFDVIESRDVPVGDAANQVYAYIEKYRKD